MKLISLFSGIGGFELAAEWIGWTPIVSCEINPFGRQVLEHYWPNAYHHDDIHTLTYARIDEQLKKRYGNEWRTDDIILTGGFPCQPYSLAGKRLGKADDRHLWPEMLRVIREIQPRWVVGENVFGIVNWDGGLVFNEVQTDLEAEGYEVQAYVLPAASVNAPHKRDRVWFVAYSSGIRHGGGSSEQKANESKEWSLDKNIKKYGNGVWCEVEGCCGTTLNSNNTRGSAGLGQVSEADGEIPKRNESAESCDASSGDAANTSNEGLEGRQRTYTREKCERKGRIVRRNFTSTCCDWAEFPTQSPIRDRNDGLSDRLAGITFPKWRQESIKAMGNAIVPQVALQIFKTIEAYEKSNP
jgi:DNA (cytosine-5)-methyltransferase 1